MFCVTYGSIFLLIYWTLLSCLHIFILFSISMLHVLLLSILPLPFFSFQPPFILLLNSPPPLYLLSFHVSLIASQSATRLILTPPFYSLAMLQGSPRWLCPAATQCHGRAQQTGRQMHKCPSETKMIVLMLTKHQSMAVAILLEGQSNVLSRSA